ncbi:uncharacterized protein LOC125478976 [Pyrus x bretschneideri]|uniref:uncharacterized protein LOC125478976 n=1 Tax=Pyrus x bretschneideri TaxID=225117 RepID=UPI0020304062|nr:uncharacterized protein LOC125478976 [Pyrus x bretschneideri]
MGLEILSANDRSLVAGLSDELLVDGSCSDDSFNGLVKDGDTHEKGYIDANWTRSISGRQSTSRNFTFVDGNLVNLKSKKHKVVARSSAEAEFRGMSHGVCELLWFKKLLRDLGFEPKGVMKLNCDKLKGCY